MTGDHYKAILQEFGLTQLEAGEWLDVSERTSQGYAGGRRIPLATVKLLQLMIRLNLKPDDVDQIIRKGRNPKFGFTGSTTPEGHNTRSD